MTTKATVRPVQKVRIEDIRVANNEQVENAITNAISQAAIDVVAKDQKKEIINWELSPSNDPSKLLNQYLMLSKIRLTSKSLFLNRN